MNSSKYPMNSYVPTKPTVKFHDLHTRLQEMTFNEVVNDPKKHFDNVYITNFDLIHHKSRGDPLQFPEKFYKTISVNDANNKVLHYGLLNAAVNLLAFFLPAFAKSDSIF